MKKLLITAFVTLLSIGVFAQESVTSTGTIAIEVTQPAASSSDSSSACKFVLVLTKNVNDYSDTYINTCEIASVKGKQVFMTYIANSSNSYYYVHADDLDYLISQLNVAE